uniref:Uncharacterized protein n=1 Tax=Zea mays TaxID=4577 RepID=B8A1W7_MAIZE|nr:unknown [Zea mays]
MSGGIQDVRAEDITAINTESAVRIKTAVGRGAYVRGSGQSMYLAPACRAHTASVADFGGVGDGTTSNTAAFRSAVDHLSQYSGEGGGGGMLYVPAGKWLTGPFNLTSHFTLYLHQDAVILGSQDVGEWPIVDPLPSYGRGRDKVGGRFASLIGGSNLTDVVITGSNGTIDGQGAMWWSKFHKNQLKYTRGYLIELMHSDTIYISNLTLLNSPAWNIHPVYSSNIVVQGITILAPTNSPNTDGINPDSCSHVRIEDCYIVSGDDCVAIKSGWDEYGISYGMPSQHIVIRRLTCVSPTSAVIALGSEMSGGGVRAAPDDAHHHEAGVLDDGRLQVPPGRQVRPQRRPRCRQHQLPGRGGHGGLQGGGAPPGHPGRTVPGHLRRQRHRRPVQVQEVPMELRRHRGSVGQRQPRAVRPATGRARRRMPVPDRHAAHRPGHSAAVRIRHPGHQLAAQSRSVFGCGSAA